MAERGLRYWLPSYAADALRRRNARATRRRGLTHILFLICDHFEPRHGIGDDDQPAARLRQWHAGFRSLQNECFERYGLKPLHTWFYPPHHGLEHLPGLAKMAFDGLGEVELHYHHGHDTRETLEAALRSTLAHYHRAGLLLQLGAPPGRRFGFIHGDWGLANSAGEQYCGVNGELSLLRELGCWGDLTMPSVNECQSRKINSIYYAGGSEIEPKSYDRGDDARVGVSDTQRLLLIQGPLGMRLGAGLRPRMENASLTSTNWGTDERIRTWIDCHVHVRGRPEWLFIKLHTHGAIERDFDALFGERARRMHRTLAEEYNDGRRYRLHYVTARQAFNLARAAECGAVGDPEQFLDWEVPPPVTSLYRTDAPHDTLVCTPDRLVTHFDAHLDMTMELRHLGVESVSGRLRALDASVQRNSLKLSPDEAGMAIKVRLGEGVRVTAVDGADHVEEDPGGAIGMQSRGEITLQLSGASVTDTARLVSQT